MLGTSDVGTADADAPPTSEKVNPAAPNAGTVFRTRFRFEACFIPGIVASSIPAEERFESGTRKILRFANVPCKVGRCADVPWAPEFMFMNDVFMSDFGAAYTIIISMIQRVSDHRNARQVGSDHELKARLDTVRPGDAASVVAFALPRGYSEGLSLSVMHRKTQPSRLNAALRLFVGSKEKPRWSNIREVSPGMS